ncbi:MAG: SMP-30/gluconolactonase/LRE family protein [Desulfovibrio sp.]|uniref:SMP-30/gluconolactonase/LRE family protein n=1 Tax=Desulfovibrio sp. TaxID=885 RepID=UPI001A741A57|nr:SMP-30/gluconolactonase/LRE family protein [Desulfovibrio sp.]MBD5416918.1 SMP-30/gluconolactonase/LRE family protein [Desulfovibrio sp.]
MKHIFTFFLLLLLGAPVLPARAAPPVPVPPAEQAVARETAGPWHTVSPKNDILEGAIFDGEGNLLFCDVSRRSVLRLTPDKALSTLVEVPGIGAGGLALNKDGRLFMAVLDLGRKVGGVLAWSPKTGAFETIVPPEAGYWPNDLVFAPDGGFYFSDFRGSATDPAGGVYYVSPDFTTVTPVIPRLAQANGVALSPDGKTLWATEFAANRLHRAQLEGPATVSPIGSAVPYHFTGAAPDSMRVDSEGNVYVALYGQGRVLCFDPNGIPVRQVLLPGRDEGKNLLSTSLAIDPAASELFIVTSNEAGDEPALVFKAGALAPGQAPAMQSGKK